jgi:capsule polysaccharide export protein KpsE/RkpR
MIAVFMIAFGAFGMVKFFESRPRYTTRVGVNVTAGTGGPEETGLLSQLGLVVSRGTSQGVAFFSELLRSAPLLRETAKGPYTVVTSKGTVTGPLARFYGFKGRPELYQDEMTKVLTDNIRMTSSVRTGNLWIFVDAPYPELSQQIAANLVAELDDFSRRRRHAQAAAEREFIQERLAEARAELRAAEEQVVQFHITNLDFSSPALNMANTRLQRDVTMKQQLYTSLLQSYDRARMDEARNQPVITELESPERPLKAERSSAASMPLLGAITGMLIAIVLAFIRERMAETSAAPTPAFDDYVELKRQAMRDLKNPLGVVGRRLKSRPDG